MLIASTWFQLEVQGRELTPETSITTMFAAVEPEAAEVRQAGVLARVGTAVETELPAEGGIVDVRWVAATPGGFAVVDPASPMVGFFDWRVSQ